MYNCPSNKIIFLRFYMLNIVLKYFFTASFYRFDVFLHYFNYIISVFLIYIEDKLLTVLFLHYFNYIIVCFKKNLISEIIESKIPINCPSNIIIFLRFYFYCQFFLELLTCCS